MAEPRLRFGAATPFFGAPTEVLAALRGTPVPAPFAMAPQAFGAVAQLGKTTIGFETLTMYDDRTDICIKHV